MKSIRLFFVYFISIGILISVYLMLRITLPYFSFATDIGFLLTKQAVLPSQLWRVAFYSHIGTGVFVLLFGLIQFNRPILLRQPALHRLSGKLYIVMILFISAPSGLVMAFYANGGFWAKTSFTILSILWWLFTFKAYTAIRKQKIDIHIAFMIRSYALTLSAITLRLYVLVLPSVIHLHAKEMYTLVAWLSWIPNLVVAELLIRKRLITLTQER